MWRDRLRSPTGQLASIAAVFVLAFVVAGVMAANEELFARYVRLKPAHVDVAGAGMVAAQRGDVDALRARPLFDNAFDSFIDVDAVDAVVATSLWAADADACVQGLHRVLVAGSAAQRTRARRFVDVVNDPRATAIVDRFAHRSR